MKLVADRPRLTLHEHSLFGGSLVLTGRHELDTDVEPHAHDFVEIVVVDGGEGRHVTASGEQELGAGDVLVLRPGAWHGFRACRALRVANCCLSPIGLRRELVLLRDIPEIHRLIWTDPITAGAYGVLSRRVSADAAAAATSEIARLEQDLDAADTSRIQMLGRLVTALGLLVDGARAPSGEAEPGVHPAVAAVMARLEEDPAESWTLGQLARDVSLDPDYLGRIFRQYAGLSPVAFLARVRVERAAVLLAQSELPVSRVGAAVGWSDPTYFARRFRTLVGLTPTEYRRRTARNQ